MANPWGARGLMRESPNVGLGKTDGGKKVRTAFGGCFGETLQQEKQGGVRKKKKKKTGIKRPAINQKNPNYGGSLSADPNRGYKTGGRGEKKRQKRKCFCRQHQKGGGNKKKKKGGKEKPKARNPCSPPMIAGDRNGSGENDKD